MGSGPSPGHAPHLPTVGLDEQAGRIWDEAGMNNGAWGGGTNQETPVSCRSSKSHQESLTWGPTSPPPQTSPASSPAAPAARLSTPAQSVFPPDCVMFVSHRGCPDLENSRRDATLALIPAAANWTVRRELCHKAAQGQGQMRPINYSWGAPRGCTGNRAECWRSRAWAAWGAQAGPLLDFGRALEAGDGADVRVDG